MTQQIYVSLLNPALSMVLSAAFLVVWLFRRDQRHVCGMSASYFAIAVAFILQSFDFGLGYEWSKFISNAILFAAAFLLASAALARQGLAVPNLAFALCCVAGMTLVAWGLWGNASFQMRVFAANWGLASICLIATVVMRKDKQPRRIDRFVMLMMALRGLELFARPTLVALFDGFSVAEPNIVSPYWVTTSFATALFSLLFALSLLTAVATDALYELRAEASTDPLSGVLNRRGFDQQCTALLADTNSSVVPSVLVLADLDNFKALNDRYGHQSGDQVIASFGNILRDVVGFAHPVGRVGGEEFALLLHGGDAETGKAVALGLGLSLSELTGTSNAGKVLEQTTASFGIAQRRDNEGLTDMMRRADAALYEAKRAGRNCVVVEDSGAFHVTRIAGDAGNSLRSPRTDLVDQDDDEMTGRDEATTPAPLFKGSHERRTLRPLSKLEPLPLND